MSAPGGPPDAPARMPQAAPGSASYAEQPLQPLAVDASEAAALYGISRAHWMRLVASGRAPSGAKLGTRRIWARAELEAWLAASCPTRARWEAMQREARR